MQWSHGMSKKIKNRKTSLVTCRTTSKFQTAHFAAHLEMCNLSFSVLGVSVGSPVRQNVKELKMSVSHNESFKDNEDNWVILGYSRVSRNKNCSTEKSCSLYKLRQAVSCPWRIFGKLFVCFNYNVNLMFTKKSVLQMSIYLICAPQICI